MEREEEGGDGDERGGGAVRVLVVDDSPLDRKIVERLLLKNGDGDDKFEVIAADSGKKAMEVLGLNKEKTESHDPQPIDDGKIDIILTDYCMPEMDGYDLLMAVKENPHSKSIPVIIMSSEKDQPRMIRCCASGAEEFIIKPLKPANIQKLRSYARPPAAVAAAPKAGTKRKLPVEIVTDSNGSERRPCLAGLAVA